jgi:hypothetical protein
LVSISSNARRRPTIRGNRYVVLQSGASATPVYERELAALAGDREVSHAHQADAAAAAVRVDCGNDGRASRKAADGGVEVGRQFVEIGRHALALLGHAAQVAAESRNACRRR